MEMLSTEFFSPGKHVFRDRQRKGNWELDLKHNNLSWSPAQFRLYGYEPNELVLNDGYFITHTTHASDIERVTTIVKDALQKHEGYCFKRRIIKKDGSLGFVETNARIIRKKNGTPQKIIGTTANVAGLCDKGSYAYGDPAFFASFYSKYKKAVMVEIFRWTYDNVLTKDLCQEVFLKAWNNMSRYDSEKGELYTWLINITRNHCKDYLRSKGFRNKRFTHTYEDVTEPVYEEVSNALERSYIKQLVLNLPIDQREIIDLLFMQGFTQAEVAKLKQLPVGTVKSRSRSALKFLKALLMRPQHAMLREELMYR